jgi:hypothetical protein
MSGVRAASAGPSELERGRVAGELEELDTRPEKGDEE